MLPSAHTPCFNVGLHVKYFLKCLDVLPQPYTSLDTNRLTVVYFCVAGLDVLGAMDKVDAQRIIRWVYAQQVGPCFILTHLAALI
jgi:geranylgeranyl transferase type-1 subunit beta